MSAPHEPPRAGGGRTPSEPSARRHPADWRAGPVQPALPDGAVDVWRVDLAAVGDELAELLCEEERARAARFLRADDGRRWARSRGTLRALLGRYLREDPRAVRIVVGAHGKPALRDGELCFNLSHSGTLALYAFSASVAVGVDVETAGRPIDEAAIAERVLGSHQADRLREIADPAARRREFLRAWTRREAELKCLGVGLGGGGGIAAAGNASDDEARCREPHVRWVAELDVDGGAAAAVACAQAPRELRCWTWG